MNFRKIFRVVKKLAPIAIAYGPMAVAAVKEGKKAVKKPKPE